jgi:hypothetical protein
MVEVKFRTYGRCCVPLFTITLGAITVAPVPSAPTPTILISVAHNVGSIKTLALGFPWRRFRNIRPALLLNVQLAFVGGGGGTNAPTVVGDKHNNIDADNNIDAADNTLSMFEIASSTNQPSLLHHILFEHVRIGIGAGFLFVVGGC